MSQLDFQRFIEIADQDSELTEQIIDIGSDSARLIELGRKNDFHFTETDIKDFRQSMVDSFRNTVEQIRQVAEADNDTKLLNYAKYLELTGEDADFAEKVKEAGLDMNRIIELAGERGFVFDQETFEKVNEIISSYSDDELTDEDLENVAGGIVTAGAALVVGGGVCVGVVAGAAVGVCVGAGVAGAAVGIAAASAAVAGIGIGVGAAVGVAVSAGNSGR